jgi:hypothetical protein
MVGVNSRLALSNAGKRMVLRLLRFEDWSLGCQAMLRYYEVFSRGTGCSGDSDPISSFYDAVLMIDDMRSLLRLTSWVCRPEGQI